MGGAGRSRTEKFLGIRPGDVVAFVGGGGKSTLITSIARRLAQDGRKVLMAATRPFLPEPGASPYLFLTDERPFGDLLPNLTEHGAAAVSPERLPDGRLKGYRPEETDTFADVGDYLFVEAEDAGGASLPPADNPRGIPPLATVLAVVAGLDALGPDFDCVAFAERLAGPDGLLRTPTNATRRLLLLNKADRNSIRRDGAKVTKEVHRLLRPAGPEVKILLTSVRDFLRSALRPDISDI